MTENATVAVAAAPRRKFVFNGMELSDPDSNMTPDAVCQFHSLLRGELTNANIKGPKRNADGVDEYEFKVQVGKFG